MDSACGAGFSCCPGTRGRQEKTQIVRLSRAALGCYPPGAFFGCRVPRQVLRRGFLYFRVTKKRGIPRRIISVVAFPVYPPFYASGGVPLFTYHSAGGDIRPKIRNRGRWCWFRFWHRGCPRENHAGYYQPNDYHRKGYQPFFTPFRCVIQRIVHARPSHNRRGISARYACIRAAPLSAPGGRFPGFRRPFPANGPDRAR